MGFLYTNDFGFHYIMSISTAIYRLSNTSYVMFSLCIRYPQENFTNYLTRHEIIKSQSTNNEVLKHFPLGLFDEVTTTSCRHPLLVRLTI